MVGPLALGGRGFISTCKLPWLLPCSTFLVTSIHPVQFASENMTQIPGWNSPQPTIVHSSNDYKVA
jgi:hypothetical protein